MLVLKQQEGGGKRGENGQFGRRKGTLKKSNPQRRERLSAEKRGAHESA